MAEKIKPALIQQPKSHNFNELKQNANQAKDTPKFLIIKFLENEIQVENGQQNQQFSLNFKQFEKHEVKNSNVF